MVQMSDNDDLREWVWAANGKPAFKKPGDVLFVDSHEDVVPPYKASDVIHLDPDPPDLTPLILLELQKIRNVLHHLVPSDEWKSLIRGSINMEATWEDQMKNLGHWDERYDE